MTQGQAGQPVQLSVDFSVGGALTDADSIQLDVTYGSELGVAPDVYGPITYQGSQVPVGGQVWRTGTGTYSAVWPIPASAQGGVYVANWTITYQGTSYPGTENFPVQGGMLQPVPAGDTGFWTGGLIYGGLDIEFGRVDGNGIAWLWQKLTGWDGPPVQGAGVIARSGDHGGVAAPQYFAPRTMTLTVTASAPTQALRDVARSLLQQVIPVSDLAKMRYDEPVPKVAYVRRSGQITEAYPTLADVTFTCGLVAPDMRKYGVQQTALQLSAPPTGVGGGMVVPFTLPVTLAAGTPPGGTTAVNNGNFESPPVFVIVGPCTAPQVTNLSTGHTVSWSSLQLAAGQTMVVDTLNRQSVITPTTVSTIPGTPSTGGSYWPADVPSAWWRLPPGTSVLQFGAAAIGSGCTCTAYYSDAWSLQEAFLATSIATSLPQWLAGCTYDGTNGNDLRNSGVVPHLWNQGILSGSVIGTRPGVIGGAGLAVTAASGMNVTVGPGSFTVPVAGSPQSGAYVATLAQSGSLSVTAADASNPRIDLVYAAVADNGNSTSSGFVQYLAGTAAASPAAPATPAGGTALATITVPAQTTSITAGMIADQRQFTAAPGGVLVAPKGSTPGYQGALAFDVPSGSFYHNSSTGQQQARVLPFAPVQASNTASVNLGHTSTETTLATVTFASDGQTDIVVTESDPGIYMNVGSSVSFWVVKRYYLDSVQVFAYNTPQNVNVGASNTNGGGTTVLYSGSGGACLTPSAGTHTVKVTATEYGQGAGTNNVFMQAPMLLRVSPASV